MTQRAIKVVSQEPLLQAFPVENVQAPQFANFLRAIYLFQTNSANELSIDGLRQPEIPLRGRPPLLERASWRDLIQLAQPLTGIFL